MTGTRTRQRLALVGAGRWGRRLLPAFQARFDVAACCTTGGAAGADWLRSHHPDVCATTDLDVVLADESIDAVAVATPISTHAELVERALRAGKHVFVEKPLATSTNAAERLAELAAAQRLVLFTGHVLLYDPVFEQLGERTRGDGAAFVRTVWRKLGTFDSDLLWNLASHHVSLALALMEHQPDEVALLGERARVTGRDWALLRLGFPEAREAIVEVDRTWPHPSRSIAVETRSGARFVWDGDVLYELRGEQFHELARGGNAIERELDAFLAAVEEGAPFPSTPRHAVSVVAALEPVATPADAAALAVTGPLRP